MKSAARTVPSRSTPPLELIVIDTETTGFGASARLVEVAAIHVRDGEPVREFHSLVDPGLRIPYAATAIHGITDAMVRGAPTAAVVLREFVAFAAGRPLVAHNAGFDRGILFNEFARSGLASPGLALYCTLRLARRTFPHAPNHRLGTLADYLALERAPSHRALADAHTALALLRACMQGKPASLARFHGLPARL